ncbi:AP-4 complex accessory subunit RUSC2 [Hoplias malabaricus]|uniref:AP-4 complex accessory subunit RUSC2 n=1 Tax=Hoplias malabaricus TaxID=27720 RepID=UPI003463577D
MAASAKLLGETMIVRNIPLAHGQSVGCQLYSPVQRPQRPCSLKLTQSISLPERQEPPKEALDLDLQSHSSKSSSNDEGGNVGGYKPFPTIQEKTDCTGSRSSPRWQNPFLPESEVHEDEDDEDSDGDNLHKYREGSSFQLHGNSNRPQDEALLYTTEIWLSCSSPECSHKLKMFHHDVDLIGMSRECRKTRSLSDSSLQHRRDSKSTPMLMDCEEQDWGGQEDYDAYILKEQTCETSYVQSKSSDSESSTHKPTEYISDSSCNSSDGVLVNFSAIYNKTNNAVPATPHDLDSPANTSQGSRSMSQDEDCKHIPCWSPCGVDPNCNIYRLDSDGLASPEISDLTACLQSQARLMTSTQNYYKLVTCDLSSQSSLSPAWSSVTSCSEAHSQGSLTPPTEYFLFRQPEGEEVDEIKMDQGLEQRDPQTDEDVELKRSKRTIRDISKGPRERQAHGTTQNPTYGGPDLGNRDYSGTAQSQSWHGTHEGSSSPKLDALPRVPSCPSRINLDLPTRVTKQHVTSFAELARCKKATGDSSSMENRLEVPTCSRFAQNTSPIHRKEPLEQKSTLITNQSSKTPGNPEDCETPSKLEGACASSPELVRYTKAQRPTFLPIQPFVLQPPSVKHHSKGLGSLLNQYISHKHGKPGSSKSTGKCRGASSYLRPSPLGTYSSVHLEQTTSSDTCSTCTPSPVQPPSRTHWAQPSPLLLQNHLDPEEPNRKQSCLAGQTHPTVRNSSPGQKKTSPKPFLTMEHLQNPIPEQGALVLKEQVLDSMPRTQEPYNSSPAVTSVTSLSLDATLKSQQRFRGSSDVADTSEELNTTSTRGLRNQPGMSVLLKELHSEFYSLTDGPPEEFCLSPDASTEVLSIELLQKKGMLKALRSAVDLITAHFSSTTDPEVRIRLGTSSLCPGVSQMVLGQLCPAIRNILQDGLKAFKLDLIVGQRRNKPWRVVEAATRPGPSTRILHSLVSVVGKCSQLTNHSMRLNAFFLGLLNLRALDSWFRHLLGCVDVVAEYYHHWSFLALSQGPVCSSLFQELLLILQPLNQLPFDLHLLSEPWLRRKLAQKPSRSLTRSGCMFLHKPYTHKKDRHLGEPDLKAEREQRPLAQKASSQTPENLQDFAVEFFKQPELFSAEDEQKAVSLVPSEGETAGWWLGQTPILEGMTWGVCSGRNGPNEEKLITNAQRMEDGLMLTSPQEKPQIELRWARLFGSGVSTSVTTEKAQKNHNQPQRTRLPSQWLKLGASTVDLLAHSVWGRDAS